MKVEIKQHNKEKKAWVRIDAYKFLGKSIMEYMINTESRIIAGIFDGGEKPVLYICNNEKDCDNCRKQGIAMMIQDLEKILNTESMPKVVLDAFPDSTFEAMESTQ